MKVKAGTCYRLIEFDLDGTYTQTIIKCEENTQGPIRFTSADGRKFELWPSTQTVTLNSKSKQET